MLGLQNGPLKIFLMLMSLLLHVENFKNLSLLQFCVIASTKIKFTFPFAMETQIASCILHIVFEYNNTCYCNIIKDISLSFKQHLQMLFHCALFMTREDMKHFPQCIASNGIFCTGGHVRYLLLNTSTKVTWVNFDDLALPYYWV